jgi:hypothetical protein
MNGPAGQDDLALVRLREPGKNFTYAPWSYVDGG